VKTEPNEFQRLSLNCDNCSYKFELDPRNIKTEFLGHDVEWRYFSCPDCKLRFTTYVGDELTERMISRRNVYRKNIQTELAKGEKLNRDIYWQNTKADELEAKNISRRTRKLKKEWKIDEREKEFVL
jgi:transcriptional regulator NrdR family protein